MKVMRIVHFTALLLISLPFNPFQIEAMENPHTNTENLKALVAEKKASEAEPTFEGTLDYIKEQQQKNREQINALLKAAGGGDDNDDEFEINTVTKTEQKCHYKRCAICLDLITTEQEAYRHWKRYITSDDRQKMLWCTHEFHAKCINHIRLKERQEDRNCPECRAPVAPLITTFWGRCKYELCMLGSFAAIAPGIAIDISEQEREQRACVIRRGLIYYTNNC